MDPKHLNDPHCTQASAAIGTSARFFLPTLTHCNKSRLRDRDTGIRIEKLLFLS